MTVTSLLSKHSFIHTAVPASNMLLGGLAHLVRFSPCVVQPFFCESKCQRATYVLKDLQAIQTGTQFLFLFLVRHDHNTNARHHERSSGRQWGQRSKNTKNIKQTKRWQKMESLQKGCLKINESGKTRNREPEVVSLQNDARKRHLKSQLLIKRSSTNIQLPYHEESRHLIKWYGCLKSNEGAKTLCFL